MVDQFSKQPKEVIGPELLRQKIHKPVALMDPIPLNPETNCQMGQAPPVFSLVGSLPRFEDGLRARGGNMPRDVARVTPDRPTARMPCMSRVEASRAGGKLIGDIFSPELRSNHGTTVPDFFLSTISVLS